MYVGDNVPGVAKAFLFSLVQFWIFVNELNADNISVREDNFKFN